MPATTTRAGINRRDAARTPAGKTRAKSDADKHGMTARTPVLPGEDPDDFRGRLDAWAEALAPADVVELFLVEQAATASWKIERTDRIEAALIAAALRDAEADGRRRRREHAARLGERLLGLDGSAVEEALSRMVSQLLNAGADHQAAAVDGCDHPRRFIGRLEATAEGCAWLLERWAELRAPLERGTDWDEDRYCCAVRLSGLRPLEIMPEERERRVKLRGYPPIDLSAAFDGEAGPEEPEVPGAEDITREELEALLDAHDAQLDEGWSTEPSEPDPELEAKAMAEDCRAMGRQLVEDLPTDEAGVRTELLGVVDRASGRLTGLAAAHEDRAAAEAEEQSLRSSFDASTGGEQLRRYHLGCERSLRQTLETLLKLRREGRAAGRAAGRGEGRSASPTAAPDQAIAPPSCSPDEADAPVVAPWPPQDEAAAPGVDPMPGPDEAPTAPDAPSSLQDNAPARFVGCSVSADLVVPPDPAPTDHPTGLPGSAPRTTSRSPVQGEAIARIAAQPPPQDEATAPTGGSARKEPAGLVTAVALLALLSSTGLAAAFGRSTDVTTRPSPISAQVPRGPRAAHPGGDPRGHAKIPPGGGTPARREHRPRWSPAFGRPVGDDPTEHRASTIRGRSDSPRGIANPVRIQLRWQFSS